jgi:hypothetical protein
VIKWIQSASGRRIKKKSQAFNQQVDWWTQWVQSASGPVNAKKAQSRSDQARESSIGKWTGERVQSAKGSVDTKSSSIGKWFGERKPKTT